MSTDAVSGFKLSQQQQRAWLQHSSGLAPCCRGEWRIRGSLDETRLRTALQSVIARHEILRTLFHHQSGMILPFQIIQADGLAQWSDMVPVGAGDLEHGNVVQASLYVDAAGFHTLILQLPVLLADARSMQLLGEEVAHAYTHRAAPDDVLQYADFVSWQDEFLTGADSKVGRDYWRDQCRKLDFTARSPLPFERATEAGRYAPEALVVSLGSEHSARLDALAARHDLSAADPLCCAWAVLLRRLTHRSDLILGLEVDGRQYEELNGAVGLFAKLLPLPFAPSAATPFVACTQQLHQAIGTARSWEASLAWGAQQNPGGIPGGPVLPFHFSYRELGTEERCGDLSWRLQSVHAPIERGTLGLAVERGSEGLELRFEYDAARLSASRCAPGALTSGPCSRRP